jgi:hypothetical protein
MVILAKTAPWAARLLQRFRDRYPKAGGFIDQAESRAEAWWQKLASFWQRPSG